MRAMVPVLSAVAAIVAACSADDSATIPPADVSPDAGVTPAPPPPAPGPAPPLPPPPACAACDAGLPSICEDGVQDGDETAIDCGGTTCPKCRFGLACKIDADCASNACDGLTHTCAKTTCDDRAKDGDESDVDCGGATCPACGDGKACVVDSDCITKACDAVSLQCVTVACADHRKDGAETDVDCGGGCAPCADGLGCKVDADCTSRNCDAGTHTCKAPSCSDGKVDGAESDVDCGGTTCAGCALGQVCYQNRDCASTGCNPFIRKCITPTCYDQIADGNETGIDCGVGTCPPCAGFSGCKVNADCQSNACDPTRNLCIPSTCFDGVIDAWETDVDCGGGICHGCALGQMCGLDSDCASQACNAVTRVCITDQCADLHLDGQETDIDCGGPTCASCTIGKKCLSNTDCAAGLVCSTGFPHVCN